MTGKNETIVDRVVARLKAQPLGDLITEEDLHDIVKEAIPKTFFEKRRVETGSGYSQRFEDKEPLVCEVMRDLLKDSAKQAVADWLAGHAEEMAAYWKQVCDESLLKYVQGLQSDQATVHVRTALRLFFEDINKERMNRGLPTIAIF